MKLSLAAALALSVLATGCASILAPKLDFALPSISLGVSFSEVLESSRHDVHIRYDADRDECLIVELRYGIDIGLDARRTTDLLRQCLAGARVLPSDGSWLVVDVDRCVMDSRERPVAERSEVERRLLELDGAIRVVETSFFEDDAGRLGLSRSWRISRAREVVQTLDAWIQERLTKSGLRFDEHRPRFPIYDRATEELWKRRVAAQEPILLFDDGQLVLDLPMSEQGAARALLDLKDESLDAILVGVNAVRARDGHVEFRCGEREDGWARWLGSDDGRPECPLIRKFLASSGFDVRPIDAGAAAMLVGLERLPPARSSR